MSKITVAALIALILATAYVALSRPAEVPDRPPWDLGVPMTADWDRALAQVRDSGKLLFVYSGWAEEQDCLACQGFSDALRALAAGTPGYERHRQWLSEHFVFLGLPITDVEQTFAPRGPRGPFRIQAHEVPLLIIKDPQGRTLVDQRSFYPTKDDAVGLLARLLETAMTASGRVGTVAGGPVTDGRAPQIPRERS